MTELPQELIDRRLVGEREAIEAKYNKVLKELYNLTSGGSEFVNDPEACIKYIRDGKQRQFKFLKQQVKRRQKAEKQFRQLEDDYSNLRNFVDKLKKSIHNCQECARKDHYIKMLETQISEIVRLKFISEPSPIIVVKKEKHESR